MRPELPDEVIAAIKLIDPNVNCGNDYITYLYTLKQGILSAVLSYIPVGYLTVEDWILLMRCRPEVVNNCPASIWIEMCDVQWATMIRSYCGADFMLDIAEQYGGIRKLYKVPSNILYYNLLDGSSSLLARVSARF